MTTDKQTFGRAVGVMSAADAHCSREPIHRPGMVQPHGVLLAVDPDCDHVVVAASGNARSALGTDPLGRGIAELFGPAFAATLADRHSHGALAPSMPWETTAKPLAMGGRCFESSAHHHDGLTLIELEETDPDDAERGAEAILRLQRAIAGLRANEGGLAELARSLVSDVRRLTQYERVLVYMFDEGWNGQAIAEDRDPNGPPSLQGLHFPASDIPSQARALYHKSLMRWVASRDAAPAPLLMAAGWEGRPVDLSHARLRSLSPTHMQYHRNMGVDGSMSLSILSGGRLWGLVVCHHRRPHRTSAGQRAAAAALTDAFALRVGPADQASNEAARQDEQRRFIALIACLAQADELGPALTRGPTTMLDMFGASAAALVRGDTAMTMGAAPPEADVVRLAAWLREQEPPGGVFACASLSALNPAWAAHSEAASGVLAAFLDADRVDVLIWFRPEEPKLVSWGGNPHKAAQGTPAPRLSFERWVEERRGTARRWADFEIEIAKLLTQAISDVILHNLRRIAVLNDQLRQSQKMEAVGQLTGGLAHHFNNLLGGVTGAIELAQSRSEQGRTADVVRFHKAALGAAERAAALTQRLLAFSRRQTLNPRPTALGPLIASVQALAERIVGPSIQVEAVLQERLWTVLCDGSQLESALLNLALNGRDAMADGGRLMIEARNEAIDEASAAHFHVKPGDYVAVSVSDTGEGMTLAVAARAFEPFFTTKPVGTGTGLGLSMVYGFAKQSGGHARIFSEPGAGTTVRLNLPRHASPGVDEVEPTAADEKPRGEGGAKILVVDDEPVLRMLICEALREHGYAVLEAADGIEALGVFESGAPIDLLVTDVGLPGGLTGRQVVDAMRLARPELRVLFITGYAEKPAFAGGILNPLTHILTKPFSMQALSAKVGALLT